jgi:hypoxia up-regulated 1
MRFPQWTYGQLKNLIGKPFNDPAVTGYDSSNPRFASDRGTVVFQHDQDEVYEVEELVAMLLKHCKKQAEDYGGVKVSGAVITVPPDFSQFERQAILDAGDIADLKILGLIHDETAVAISYVLGKKFETLEYHLFYDMGAGSTVATLVSFQSGKTALTKKNIDVMIKGYATDSDLGGLQVDIRIQRHLASEFAKVNKGKLSGDIFKDNRAMARLMKEANRVKTILSANQNVLSSVRF